MLYLRLYASEGGGLGGVHVGLLSALILKCLRCLIHRMLLVYLGWVLHVVQMIEVVHMLITQYWLAHA